MVARQEHTDRIATAVAAVTPGSYAEVDIPFEAELGDPDRFRSNLTARAIRTLFAQTDEPADTADSTPSANALN